MKLHRRAEGPPDSLSLQAALVQQVDHHLECARGCAEGRRLERLAARTRQAIADGGLLRQPGGRE